MDNQLSIRLAEASEVGMLLDWAQKEGWNPGVHDATAFFATDPQGFVVAESDGVVVGAGAIVAYDKSMGFMGLFIVKPEFRGKGYGRELWFRRLEMLKSRLGPDGIIGLDGVEAMQGFYAKGGFKFSHNAIRYVGKVNVNEADVHDTQPAHTISFDDIAAFDKMHFGVERREFLKIWLQPPLGAARVVVNDQGVMIALGVIRKCVDDGYKIGPLFADNFQNADKLFRALAATVRGENIYLDTPVINENALALARKYNFSGSFTCGRMYYGDFPALPWQNVYGVTTFELG